MKKMFNYYTLALILKSLYESCMKHGSNNRRVRR